MNSPNTKNRGFESKGSIGVSGTDGVASHPATAGKWRGLVRTMGIISGVALTMGFTSCLMDHDGYGHGYTTIHSTGHSINSLPRGYRSETISGRTYYYHDGYYYRPDSGRYVVVEAPRRSRYYDDYSRYQRTRRSDHGYRQTSGRRDSRYDDRQVINRLPSGYREINHRGNTYYRVGDRYYSRHDTGYIVVNRPY